MDDIQERPTSKNTARSSKSKLSSSISRHSSSTTIPQINYLLENIIQSLKEEWISECDELCHILQKLHLVTLLNVVDCVARQIYDLDCFDYLFSNQKIHDYIDHLSNQKFYHDDDDQENGLLDDYLQNGKKFSIITAKKRSRLPCQKIVNVFKSQEPLGVTVRFDEQTGDIVLARILVGGAAYRSGLVNVGDRILEVNGITLRGRSHLDVINILQRECMKTMITFKILMKSKLNQNDQSNKPYMVKAHFDYNPEQDPHLPCPKIGLAFDKGSILNVLNKEDSNWWQASKEIEPTNKSRMEIFQIAGLIPSKSLQERRIVAIRDVKSQIDRHRYVHILGGLLPLPFKKNRWCSQKIKKIMYDLSDCIKYDREEICTYEPVAKYFPRPEFCRPIILIGPSGVGCSLLINLLCNHNPERYREPLAHTTRFKRLQENDSIDYYFVSEDWMENEIQMGNFVCYTKHRGNYYGIHKETIKQIIDSGSVCIFKMDARFLRLVHTAEFKPYIIFIRPPLDINRLYELRNQYFLQRTHSGNSYRKSRQWLQYEMHLMIYESHKLQILYGHKFDSVIVNENIQETYETLYEIVNSVENKPSWIPITWVNKSSDL